MRALIIVAALFSTLATASPAFADPPPWAPAWGRRAHDAERGGYYSRHYDSDRSYGGYGYRCHRSSGTTGLIVGGAAGALLGRSLDGGRDRATGTILGGAAGALLGREVGRQTRCR